MQSHGHLATGAMCACGFIAAPMDDEDVRAAHEVSTTQPETLGRGASSHNGEKKMNNPSNITPGGAPRKRMMRTSRVRRGLMHIIEHTDVHLATPHTDECLNKLSSKQIAEMHYALAWCREQATMTARGAKPKDDEAKAEAA